MAEKIIASWLKISTNNNPHLQPSVPCKTSFHPRVDFEANACDQWFCCCHYPPLLFSFFTNPTCDETRTWCTCFHSSNNNPNHSSGFSWKFGTDGPSIVTNLFHSGRCIIILFECRSRRTIHLTTLDKEYAQIKAHNPTQPVESKRATHTVQRLVEPLQQPQSYLPVSLYMRSCKLKAFLIRDVPKVAVSSVFFYSYNTIDLYLDIHTYIGYLRKKRSQKHKRES